MTQKVIRPTVGREIERIRRFISMDNVSAAQRVVDRIHEVIDGLTRNPRMGHEAISGSLRMLAVTPYPYLIYYRYLPRRDEVVVIAVRHAARRRTVELREHEHAFRYAIS